MTCPHTGKLRHADQAAAVAAKGRLPHGSQLAPYHCMNCDGWHLGGHHRRHQGDELNTFGPKRGQDLSQFGGPGKPIGGTTIGDRLRGKDNDV